MEGPLSPSEAGRVHASTAAVVDGAAGGRVLVFGSLPPEGRDLDLLVLPGERERVERRLVADGFLRKGSTWARFAAGSVDSVDLVAAAEWRLPEMEIGRLFADAEPLEGFANIVRPAAHHELLVLARAAARAHSLSEGRRQRFRVASAVPGAWSRAEHLARAWHLEAELTHLGKLAALPTSVAPARFRRVRPPRVVALCGIDGAGKTTQAAMLRETLERLGYDAVVAWQPLSQGRFLGDVARVAKRLVESVDWPEPPAPARDSVLSPDVGAAVRARSSAAKLAWTILVAGANASFNARATARHSLCGRVVIFDRFVLDSFAGLRFLYGEHERFVVQKRVVRLLTPRPLAAFWLDVPAEAAFARKNDWWTLPDLRLQERLYRDEVRTLPVTRLDGQRPQADLAAEIAATVWQRLP